MMFRKKFREMKATDRFTKPTSESPGRNVFSHLKATIAPFVIFIVACFVFSSVTSSGSMPPIEGLVRSCSQEQQTCNASCATKEQEEQVAQIDCKTTFEAAEQAAVAAGDYDAFMKALIEYQECYNDADHDLDACEIACENAHNECLKAHAHLFGR